jgi:hypothetical protein
MLFRFVTLEKHRERHQQIDEKMIHNNNNNNHRGKGKRNL